MRALTNVQLFTVIELTCLFFFGDYSIFLIVLSDGKTIFSAASVDPGDWFRSTDTH